VSFLRCVCVCLTRNGHHRPNESSLTRKNLLILRAVLSANLRRRQPPAPRWSVPAPFTLLLCCRPTPLRFPPPSLLLPRAAAASLPTTRAACPIQSGGGAVACVERGRHVVSMRRRSSSPLSPSPFSLPQFLLSQLKSGLSRASRSPHCTSDAAAHQLRS
jgi:hypothetical protein